MKAKRMPTRSSNSIKLKPAEPYYDFKTKSTRYSTKGDVYNFSIPRKAKRK